MKYEPEPKFWVPRLQTWASIPELQYLKMQAREQQYLIRETPADKIESTWAEKRPAHDYANSQARLLDVHPIGRAAKAS